VIFLFSSHMFPSSGSTLRGWELLSICCGLFVPSRTLGPYLLDHLVQAKSDTVSSSIALIDGFFEGKN